jgi:hypothetical protein
MADHRVKFVSATVSVTVLAVSFEVAPHPLNRAQRMERVQTLWRGQARQGSSPSEELAAEYDPKPLAIRSNRSEIRHKYDLPLAPRPAGATAYITTHIR